MSSAKKKDPKKWARAKARARAKMGGHSARAMQLAVKYYKQAGGRYSGKKSSGNKLSKWSKQKWDYVSTGDKKKPKKKKEVVTCLSQLGKALVPVKKVLQIKQKEKPQLQEKGRLSTVNQ